MVLDTRETGGRKLAEKLEENNIEVDLMLSISEGGFRVGKAVAKELNADMKFMPSEELKIRENSDVSLGAMAFDGTIWLDDNVRDGFQIPQKRVQEVVESKSDLFHTKFGRRRREKLKSEVRGKNVLLIDDGVSNGYRMGAAIGSAIKNGAQSIYVGAPVISRDDVVGLEDISDRVFAVERPRFVSSVDSCYLNQVSEPQEAKEVFLP